MLIVTMTYHLEYNIGLNEFIESKYLETTVKEEGAHTLHVLIRAALDPARGAAGEQSLATTVSYAVVRRRNLRHRARRP